MPLSDHERVSTTSLALLRPLLIALDASNSAVIKPFGGLPSPCFRCLGISTVICATPVTSVRLFRTRMVAAACENDVDIVLIRHGLAPEILDEVTFDAVMHRHAPLDVFSGMVAYRGGDGGLWLVPPLGAPGDIIRIDASGLTIATRSPWRTLDERNDGVARAAAETVRAMRARRS